MILFSLNDISTSELIQYIVIAILVLIIIIALIAFGNNFHKQIRVSLLMDNETGLFNKDGIAKYYEKKGKHFNNASLVVVELRNLAFVYANYEKRIKLMYQISDCMCKGLTKIETLGRIEFSKFIILLEGKTHEELVAFCKEIEARLDALILENYGVYQFNPIFAIREEVDLREGDSLTLSTLAIMEYSTLREGNIYFFSPEVTLALEKIANINNQKDKALEEKKFVAYVQPKIDLSTGRVAGGEVLCRWVDDNQVPIFTPSEFIPVFEKNGFIKKIDLEMFENTCQIVQSLTQKGYSNVVISVNVSKINFESPSFINDITAIISKYGVSPSNIELEITETSTMISLDYVSNCIETLHQLGFKVAMDDFGREYSSLATLSNNIFDTIKLDAFFFKAGLAFDKGKGIIKNLINLLQTVDCEIVCEGIEDMNIVNYIASITKNILIQGFVFAKPMSRLQFEDYISTVVSLDFPDIIEEGSAQIVYENVNHIQRSTNYVTENREATELRRSMEEMRIHMETVLRQQQSSQKNEEVEALKRQMEELKAQEAARKEAEHRAEIEALRRQMEEMRNKPNNDNSEYEKFRAELERERLRHQNEIDDLRRQMNNRATVTPDKDYEMERLRREIEDLKNLKNDQNRDREIEALRREIDQLRYQKNINPQREYELESLYNQINEVRRQQIYAQQPYPQPVYTQPYPQQPGYIYAAQPQQQINVEELIARLAKANKEQIDSATQSMMEQTKNQTKDIKEQLEQERRERQELEAMLQDVKRQQEEEAQEVEIDEEAIKKEQEKADAELNLEMDSIEETNENEEELDDDVEDEVEDEAEESEESLATQLSKPELTLEQIEAIIKNYQEKFQENWNQHAKEELKDGYYKVINGLKYYQGNPVVKKNFIDRIKKINPQQKQVFNIVKNEIMKYKGVTNKLTNSYDVFYKGRTQIAKISFTSSKVKIFLSVDPNLEEYSKYPHKDLSHKKAHVRTPYYAILKSSLSVKRIKQVISDMMEILKLTENESYKPIDYVTKYKFFRHDQKK